MKFRVRSGELNKIIQRPMLFQGITEITQELLIEIFKEAVEKFPKKEATLADLTSICECPLLNPENCYFIETKSALTKAGFIVEAREMQKGSDQ